MTTARPLIGICGEFEEHLSARGEDRSYLKVYHHYYHAVSRAGGLPICIPILEDSAMALDLAARCDGLLLTGGDDAPPELLGETAHQKARLASDWRSRQDTALCDWLLKHTAMPALCICGSYQTMAVRAGARLIQDLPSQFYSHLDHGGGTRHPVSIHPASRLFSLVGAGVIEVNSYHHQAILLPDRVLQPIGMAPDGVIEAWETRDAGRFLIGVQWHPERMLDDPAQRAVFAGLVTAAREFRARHS